MPNYLFENLETGEVIEVFQHMNDEHVYSKGKIKFRRVWTKPQASFDTIALDPFSKKDFVKKTGDLKSGGTMNDLYNRSKDMSMARASQAGGVDPISVQYRKDYAKARRGTKLPTRNGNHIYEGR